MTYRELMRLANGYAESKVLLVGNELGVFTAIGTGSRQAAHLATSCGTTREGMTLLLSALAGLGLLRFKDGRYSNTRLGLTYLDSRSPLAVTNLLWLLNHHWSDWTGMTGSLRRGRRGWAPLTKTAGFRRRFALAMHERSHVLAPPTIDSFRLPRHATRFLDLGGGSGSYSIALARRYPQLHGVVVDQSVAVARRLIRAEGLADRIAVRQGNVFSAPLDPDLDIVLLSNLLHDFDERENLRLLRRLHRALRPGERCLWWSSFSMPRGRSRPMRRSFRCSCMRSPARDAVMLGRRSRRGWLLLDLAGSAGIRSPAVSGRWKPRNSDQADRLEESEKAPSWR